MVLAIVDGDRVQVKADTTQRVFSYRAGQRGTVRFVDPSGKVSVVLDGYALQRFRNFVRRLRTGEGANLVPWSASFKPSELEKL